jgi:hypothetical protein
LIIGGVVIVGGRFRKFKAFKFGRARLPNFLKVRARCLDAVRLIVGKAKELPSRGPACGHVHHELRLAK